MRTKELMQFTLSCGPSLREVRTGNSKQELQAGAERRLSRGAAFRTASRFTFFCLSLAPNTQRWPVHSGCGRLTSISN